KSQCLYFTFSMPFPIMSEPIRVLVTGGAVQIAYSLLYSIGNGSVFNVITTKKRLPSKTWMWPLLWAPCQEGMAWSGKIYSKQI
uniref:Uncharacterized protein n=1 Tax=Bos indicus x Bos taurus TaxID=30522 RepID=A0A4W2HUZ1_BOBOX